MENFISGSSVSHTQHCYHLQALQHVYATPVGFYSVVVEQSQLEKYVLFCDEAKYTTDWKSKCHTANGTVLQ
jgi:hypothetical protein